MNKKEKLLLREYRYNKLCRLENNEILSRNILLQYDNIDNRVLLTNHSYDSMYLSIFKDIMNEIFELLKLTEKESNIHEKKK